MTVESRPVIKVTKEEEDIIFKVYNGVVKAYNLDDKADGSESFARYLEDIFDCITNRREHTIGNTTIEYEN